MLQPGRADLIDYLWRLCRYRLTAPTLVAATFLRDAAAAAVGAGGREEHHSCDIPKERMLRWRGRLRSLNERVFAVLADLLITSIQPLGFRQTSEQTSPEGQRRLRETVKDRNNE